MTKRFRCTPHYAGDGSVTMISCVMVDEPDEELRYYIRELPWALYRVQGDDVEVWRAGGWHLTPLTTMQLDGLGGDAYYRVRPEDVERAKARAAPPTLPGGQDLTTI